MSILGSIAGSVIPGLSAGASAFSAYSGYKANQENLKFAKQTRDLLVNQANTTFRRGRTDMLAAGLNPLLMSKAGGDPTPALPSSAGQSAVPDASSGIASAYQAHAQRSLAQAQAAQAQGNAAAAQGLPAVQAAQIDQLHSAAQASLMQGSAAQTSANANMTQALSAAGVNKARIPLILAQIQGQNQQNALAYQQFNTNKPQELQSLFQADAWRRAPDKWAKQYETNYLGGIGVNTAFQAAHPYIDAAGQLSSYAPLAVGAAHSVANAFKAVPSRIGFLR